MNDDDSAAPWDEVLAGRLGVEMRSIQDQLTFLGRGLTVDQALNADLTELYAVLRQKRGCRRG